MARATDSNPQSWVSIRQRGLVGSLAFVHPGWFALVAAIGWATWARWSLLTAGPPLDTDAFAHAIIARRMLDDWRDVRVHWVWLPMWHIVGAISARFGGGIAALRSIGVLLSAVAPILLTVLLRRHAMREDAVPRRVSDDVVPFAAGGLLAVWPLCVRGGATGQPEPLFQCLVLLACLAWESKRSIATGAVLAAAVMLRYEAWVLVPVFAVLWIPSPSRNARGAAAWLIPAATIAVWCAIHARQTDEWLQFVRVNREFTRDAIPRLVLPFDGSRVFAALRYPIVVPFESAGIALALALPGSVWVVRRTPRAFRAASGALLVFISYAWVRRQTLGLDRHFFVMAPLYATAVAAGAATCAEWIAERVTRSSRVLVPVVAAVLVVWLAGRITLPNVRFVRAQERIAFASDRRAASVLAAIAARNDLMVFCDRPVVEILSGLPTRAFMRWNVRDVRPYNLGVEAQRHGLVVAVSSPDRVAAIRDAAVVVFEDRQIVVLAKGRAQR